MKVIIVGGGIGGLALAQILQKKGIEYILLERESGEKFDGYSLTMNKNGIEVLQKLGIYDQLAKIEQNKNYGFKTDGSRLWIHDTWDFGSPFVRRGELINALSKGIKNRKTFDYARFHEWYESNKVAAIAKNGDMEIGDILVGCDGFKSLVREQLMGFATPLIEPCLDLMLINGISEMGDGIEPNATYYWLNGSERLFVKPYDETRVMWQLAFKSSAYDNQDPLEFARKLMLNWDTLPFGLVSRGTDVSIRKLYTSQKYNENDNPCVTLLGDAAHTLSPYKGMGANLALREADILGSCLARSNKTNAMKDYNRHIYVANQKWVPICQNATLEHHDGKVVNTPWKFDTFDNNTRMLHLTKEPNYADLCKLKNLHKLIIDYPLGDIPKEIFELKSLVYLRIVRNKICRIPDEIGNLTNLRHLHLRNNEIQYVSAEIGKLTNLLTLRLSCNRIVELPSTISNLTKLKNVCLSYNFVNDLAIDFTNMTKLKTLYFRGNRLSHVPLSLLRLTTTQKIEIKC